MTYQEYIAKIEKQMTDNNVFNMVPMLMTKDSREELLHKQLYAKEKPKRFLFFR